jgi:hypothetical protein
MADWHPNGNHLATYRGIRVVIKLSKTGSPTEIRWYIDRLLAESTPLDCDLESAKKIGIDLADRRIPMDDRWRQAEKKDQESSRHQRRGRPICVDVLICRVQLMCSGFQSPSPSEAVSRLIVLARSEIQTMDFMKV